MTAPRWLCFLLALLLANPAAPAGIIKVPRVRPPVTTGVGARSGMGLPLPGTAPISLAQNARDVQRAVKAGPTAVQDHLLSYQRGILNWKELPDEVQQMIVTGLANMEPIPRNQILGKAGLDRAIVKEVRATVNEELAQRELTKRLRAHLERLRAEIERLQEERRSLERLLDDE